MYTPWRYHQYFEVIKGHFWVREMLFKYVRLLGADSAYACNEYMAENNRNESDGRYESYQMPNEKDIVKSADSSSSMDNAGEKQETLEYQAMQEKFLQNLMNTYMMIKQTGNRR